MRPGKKFHTAGKGILGILVCAMLIPFFIISLIALKLSLSTSKNLLSENLNSSCAIQVSAIESFFRSYADSLQLISLMAPIQSFLSSDDPNADMKLVLAMLQSQMSVKTSARAIFIIDKEGTLILSTDDKMAVNALAGVDIPVNDQNQAYSLRFVKGNHTQDSTILLFCPITMQEADAPNGYMVCLMGIDYLQKQLSSTVLPDFGVMYLRDENGNTVCSISNETEDVYTDKADFETALEAALSAHNEAFSAQQSAFMQINATPSSNGDLAHGSPLINSFSFSAGEGLNHEEFMAYQSFLGATGWHFVIASRTSVLFDVLTQFALMMVFVILLGAVTWFILCVYTARRISEPMKKMVDQLSIEVQRNFILNALSGILIAEYDCETDTLHISPEYADENHFDSTIDQWLARMRRELPQGSAPLPLVELKELANVDDAGTLDCPMVFPDGHSEHYRLTFAKIRNEKNKVVRVLCRASSIEQEYHAWEELQEAASIDCLTGIYNRQAGERNVKASLFSMPETDTAAFVLIDLDHFKPINDTYGHQTGDQVLRNTAQWLYSFFRGNDIVFRLGGDEFVVLVQNISQDALKRRITDMEQQFAERAYTGPSVSFSMGVIFFDKPNADYDTLYRAADRALYRAKEEQATQIVYLIGTQGQSDQ